MADVVKVRLERETQIICQEIIGVMNDRDYERLFAETAQLRTELDNPDDVRILSIGNHKNGKLSPAIRRRAAEVLHRPEVKKIAAVGIPAVGRVMLKFLQIGTGMKKMRAFDSEEKAREWLRA